MLLASGESPPQEQSLIPYVNAATKKVTAKIGEEQNQASFLISYLVSYLSEFVIWFHYSPDPCAIHCTLLRTREYK